MSPSSAVHHYHNCTIIQYHSPGYPPKQGENRWQQEMTTSLPRRSGSTLPYHQLSPRRQAQLYKTLQKSYRQRQTLARLTTEGIAVSPRQTITTAFPTNIAKMTHTQPNRVNSPRIVPEQPSSDCWDLNEVMSREHSEPAPSTAASSDFAERPEPHKNSVLEDKQRLEDQGIKSSTPLSDKAEVDLTAPTSNDSSPIFSKKTAKGVGIAAATILIPLATASIVGYGAFVLAAAHPILLVTLGCIAVGVVGYKAFNWLRRER